MFGWFKRNIHSTTRYVNVEWVRDDGRDGGEVILNPANVSSITKRGDCCLVKMNNGEVHNLKGNPFQVAELLEG